MAPETKTEPRAAGFPIFWIAVFGLASLAFAVGAWWTAGNRWYLAFPALAVSIATLPAIRAVRRAAREMAAARLDTRMLHEMIEELGAAKRREDATGTARPLFLHLDAELARCRRTRESLAVLTLKLEGFEQIQNRFGPPAALRIRESIESGLRRGCREYDYVARNGDEWVLVLSAFRGTDLPGKRKLIGRTVAQASTEVCGEPLLAMTVGVAFYPGDGADAEDLLAQAGRRLHLARSQDAERADSFTRELLKLGESVEEAEEEPSGSSPADENGRGLP